MYSVKMFTCQNY